MSDSALYVTLGHNASAVLVVDGEVRRGYEQERIDRKKSSSAYPREAIDLALGHLGGVDNIYVSHWFDDMSLQPTKYLDVDHLYSLSTNVTSLIESFTHHDAHASSVGAFFRANGGKADDVDIMVIDGFGNLQECFSVYQNHWPYHNYPRLTHRTHGYEMSLGLMYQYTTEFLGLKPNRDEYKLLGYESHVREYATRDYLDHIGELITRQAMEHAHRMMDSTVKPEWKGRLIDFEGLEKAKAMWWERADHWRKLFDRNLPEDGVRACVAYCAQLFLEECVLELMRLTINHPNAYFRGPRPHLLLAGGSFYNVKLSRRIQVETGRRVFSHPLAGDQGAALGFSPGVSPRGLLWGARAIGARQELPPGVVVTDRASWTDVVLELLAGDRIVNVVRGAMEYGPRALCDTTTFALPNRHNVARINALNERDEAMPMAPVLTRGAALALFRHQELLEVPVADQFMITTVAFQAEPPEQLLGVAHRDPIHPFWTARPQVVDEATDLGHLCTMMDGVLINTSFNYHGEPIVFTEDDACKTHEMQCFRAKTLDIEEPVTVLVRS